jgi:hypothetical protein
MFIKTLSVLKRSFQPIKNPKNVRCEVSPTTFMIQGHRYVNLMQRIANALQRRTKLRRTSGTENLPYVYTTSVSTFFPIRTRRFFVLDMSYNQKKQKHDRARERTFLEIVILRTGQRCSWPHLFRFNLNLHHSHFFDHAELGFP